MIKKIILVLCLCGAGVALYHILSDELEYRAGEKLYAQMQEYVQIPTENTEPIKADSTEPVMTEAEEQATEPTMEPVDYPQVDFAPLLETNQDVVGWLYVEDTKINYPILLGEDNRQYISTMIDGSQNPAGSIFMDYHNTADFSDRHTILYGHNMQNGTMFADITKYRNQEYYDSHPLGLVVTPEGNFRFEIVSAYIASLADSAWQLEFVDDADALEWLTASMEKAPFASRYVPAPGDRIITLSTCSYEFDDARFVLVGVLLEEK